MIKSVQNLHSWATSEITLHKERSQRVCRRPASKIHFRDELLQKFASIKEKSITFQNGDALSRVNLVKRALRFLFQMIISHMWHVDLVSLIFQIYQFIYVYINMSDLYLVKWIADFLMWIWVWGKRNYIHFWDVP